MTRGLIFLPKKVRIRSSRLFFEIFLISHSQTTKISHPCFFNFFKFSPSLKIFFEIFFLQNSTLLLVQYLQAWPCQKQPFTKTIFPRHGKTRSGLPGRPFLWRLYRNPILWISFLMIISGEVFLLPIFDMQSCRFLGDKWSTILILVSNDKYL